MTPFLLFTKFMLTQRSYEHIRPSFMDTTLKARMNMVQCQIETTTSLGQALHQAMIDIPRQLFVPTPLSGIAYSDDHLPLGSDRYMMSPSVLAKMIQLAEIRPGDSILDIGVTTGYSSAIFSQLALRVIAIESDPDLASKANSILHSIGIKNVIVISTSLIDGHPDSGPYDAIFFNGAIETIPQSLTDQLANGGRLITTTYNHTTYNPLTHKVLGMLTLYKRINGDLSKQELFPINLFPLEEFRKKNNESYH